MPQLKMGSGEYMRIHKQISAEGIALIKKFEGCPQKDGMCYSYQDAIGVWTLGFGFTKNVGPDSKISVEEAERRLIEELKEYSGYVNRMVTVDLSQNEFDSLVAFTYNLGPTNLSESTLLKELNSGNRVRVPNEMRRWNKAGGKVLEGLVRRREAEAIMWSGGDWFEV
jgi:lysozyme